MGPGWKLPRYVYACAENRWHVHTWRFDPETGEVVVERKSPFKCLSWRHEGFCRRWLAAQNFSRVSAALAPLRPRDVLLLVLTLDPNHRQTGQPGSEKTARWKNRYEAFVELKTCWRQLRKAITKHFGKNQWVGTVEVHRSGWPHYNVILHCPVMADQVGGDWREREQLKAWLRRRAVGAGFGPRFSVERAKSKGAVAGYAVKVAGEVEHAAVKDPKSGKLVGEVIKWTQLPEQAPRHFRRLRSSVKFLPPPHKDPNVSGELKKTPLPLDVPDARGELMPSIRPPSAPPSRTPAVLPRSMSE